MLKNQNSKISNMYLIIFIAILHSPFRGVFRLNPEVVCLHFQHFVHYDSEIAFNVQRQIDSDQTNLIKRNSQDVNGKMKILKA